MILTQQQQQQQQQQPVQPYRASSPSPHYESNYLKMMQNRMPSNNSIQNLNQRRLSMETSQSLPQRRMSMETSQSLPSMRNTQMRNVPPIRAPSPIDMILDNSRRRASTPVGIRINESQRLLASSPMSFYRSPSPIYTQMSPMPNSSYSQRAHGPPITDLYSNSVNNGPNDIHSNDIFFPQQQQHLPLPPQYQYTSPNLNLTPLNIDQTPNNMNAPYTPPNLDALSPNIMNMKSPNINVPNLPFQSDHLPDKFEDNLVKVASDKTNNRDNKSEKSGGSSKNSSKKNRSEKRRSAIKFDPKHPDRYFKHIAVKVSARILKHGQGKFYRKEAEAAQLAILKASESCKDNSDETLNTLASKASMAVLDVGGDAQIAALASVTVINPGNEDEDLDVQIKETVMGIYGNASEIVKKGYNESSEVLTKISKAASEKLEEYNEYLVNEIRSKRPDKRSRRYDRRSRRNNPKKATPTFMDYVDGFVDTLRHQLNLDRDYERRDDDYKPRRSRLKTRRTSTSSSFSDDSRGHTPPPRSMLRRNTSTDDDEFSHESSGSASFDSFSRSFSYSTRSY